MGIINKQELVTNLIKILGDNPNREGLKDTPNRVVRMWNEMFKGYYNQPPKLTVFKNGKDGIKYDQMIIDTGYFYSHCEHHLVPFFGQYYFSYIPNKKVLGLSKVARVIDYFSATLQVQERLTKEVVDYIEKELKPKGVILVLKARHLCKEMRGVKKVNGQMTTSELRGVFKKDLGARSEFLQLVNSGDN